MGLEAPKAHYVRRNVSSACNSSGSALWASAKDIKPLVDANFHIEAIEFAYHQSPIRFSPIYYQNPGFMSRPPSGQTILFGYSLMLCTIGVKVQACVTWSSAKGTESPDLAMYCSNQAWLHASSFVLHLHSSWRIGESWFVAAPKRSFLSS